ncbi:MAG: hypothetical protein ACOCQQ_02565 [Candidatus Nanoarchaeia archaeon]
MQESQQLIKPTRATAKVAQLFELGLDNLRVLGYHGTSTEAIEHLAKTGYLPNTGRHENELYFYPTNAIGINDVGKETKMYSRWNAWKHFMTNQLPFEPNYDELCVFDDSYLSELPTLAKQCEEYNIFEYQLNRLLDKTKRERQGVIISLSPDIVNEFKLHTPSKVKQDKRYIKVPQGLNINYIASIEPVGQFEWNILEKYQLL